MLYCALLPGHRGHWLWSLLVSPLCHISRDGLPLLRGPPEQAHFRALLAEAYRQSWFVAPGAASLAIAFRGTRPGTPLADAIFVFVIAALIDKVYGRLKEMGMDLHLRPTDPLTLRQDPTIPPITTSLLPRRRVR
mgnify:CR=1 FL=1